jgi:hypothetical protein
MVKLSSFTVIFSCRIYMNPGFVEGILRKGIGLQQAIDNLKKELKIGTTFRPGDGTFEKASRLIQNEDVLTRTDVFEDLRPHRYAHLSEMGLAQQVHIGPGLSDTAPDAQWYLIVENGLMVG